MDFLNTQTNIIKIKYYYDIKIFEKYHSENITIPKDCQSNLILSLDSTNKVIQIMKCSIKDSIIIKKSSE